MNNYTTITDARIEFLNSGVSEYPETEEQFDEIVRRMFNNDLTPEQAVAAVMQLDNADIKALGL